MSTKTILWTAAAAVFAAAPAALAAEEADLSSKLKPGITATYDVHTENTGSANGVSLTRVIDVKLDVAVEDVTDDGAVVKLVHEKLKIVESGMRSGEYDSSAEEGADDGPSSRLGQVFSSLVGAPIYLDLDKQGRITSVRGLNDVAPGGPAGMEFRQVFNDGTIREYRVLFFMKDGVAKVGETWTHEENVESASGTATHNVDLTLDCVKGDVATISMTGSLDYEDATGQVSIEESELKATAKWDTSIGMLDETHASTKIKAKIGGFLQDIETTVDITRADG